MLAVTNIQFGLNGNKILRGIDLLFEKGHIYGLIGPNGAGKTTLLNVISGYLAPTGGDVFWQGQKISENSPHVMYDKGVIRVWQEARIFKNLTVMDNFLCMGDSPGENLLNYLFRYRKVKDSEKSKQKKALDIARQFNLKGKESNLGQELSYGQQKLLSLGRMLMLKDLEKGAKCILMDEPFTGVHEDMTGEISCIIKKIADYGNVVLLVEHNLEATFSLADTILVMNEGKIVMSERPEDIIENELAEIYQGL